MKQKIKSISLLIMIASLTTMGLISNQAFAGNGLPIVPPPSPPQIGDFRCYLASAATPINQEVILTDQFFLGGTTHTVGTVSKMCANVVKDPATAVTPITPQTHYRVYPIVGDGSPVPFTLTDQFGTSFHTVANAVELWVPAIKRDPQITAFPLSPIHWKCYDVTPAQMQPINVRLEDQFLQNNRVLQEIFKICTPVLKEHAEVVFGTLEFPDHLKCYRNVNEPIGNIADGFAFEDQFTNFLDIGSSLTVTQEAEVCLVAGKGIETFVSGTPVPIDTTMILLGATQTTASWMIPVIVSAIGIAIVIARKF